MRIRVILLFFVGASLLAMAAYGGWRLWRGEPEPIVAQSGESLIQSEFHLVDHRGQRISAEDFRGLWLLVFFGYTFCPDACPTTMSEVSILMDELGDKAERIQPLFVTIDPDRDTPEVLADYVSAFHPRIVGLTGTTEEVAAAASNFRVYYAKVEEEGEAVDYLMDHSVYLYLIDPEGNFVRPFAYGTPLTETHAAIDALLSAE